MNKYSTNDATNATIDWILNVLKRTPLPISPTEAAQNNKTRKQPGYFKNDKYYETLNDWKDYQNWTRLKPDIQERLLRTWFGNPKTDGVAANAGYNGECIVSYIDLDKKLFLEPGVSDKTATEEQWENARLKMQQAVEGWENRNQALTKVSKIKTQGGGYRYILGFESISEKWGDVTSFTFSPEGGVPMGEIMSGPGGLGIIAGKGIFGDYEWVANPLGQLIVFPNPESIGLYKFEKAIATSSKPVPSVYDTTDTPGLAREALDFIPATLFDDDYEGWVRILMACHAAGLTVDDADQWSQGSPKYQGFKDIEIRWNKFKEGGSIQAGTLFHYAKQHGWNPPRRNSGYQKPLINSSNSSAIPDRNPTLSTATKKKTTPQEIKQAVRECEKILLDVVLDDIDKAIKIEEIRQELSVSNTLWQDLLSKINRSVCEKRLNLELKALLQSEDKIKREIELSRIAQKYRLNLRSLEKMLREMEIRITTPEYESMDFEELYNMGSKAVDYLIPGLLPKGESALLVAMPKVGKSLLAVDVAFAVATGEDYFLGETCETGRVLYVSVDESRDSVVKKMIKRGFRPCDKNSIRIVTTFSINQLPKLETEIEAFKPTLVIIDSLKRITKGLEISENSAEFSDNVYTISEMCNRYGAACLLIHHSNKNTESIGVENVRGSTAITGACGNTWILNRVGKPDPDNKNKIIYDPRDTRRQLFCFSRDSEGKTLSIELNPENNSWQMLGEMGIDEEEAEQMKTTKSRILKVFELNQKHHPLGLSGSFIFDCLEMTAPGEITKGSMYTTLNRLVSDKIIGSKPAPGDKRYTLYFLPGYGQDDSDPPNPSNQTQPQPEYTTNHQPDSTVEDSEKSTIPPLPPLNDSDVMQYAETNTQYGLQIDNNSQKLDNKYITSMDEKTPVLCISNQDTEGDTAYCITRNNDRGGGVPNNQNGEEPKHTTDDDCSTVDKQTQPTMDNGTPEPQIKAIYIDPQGFPHKIMERDDGGRWRDQNGDNITPGVFRTYKPWKKQEVAQLLDQVSEAMQAFINGNTAPIAELLTNPITKAKITVIKGSIKNHIGTDAFNKLYEYAKNLKKQS